MKYILIILLFTACAEQKQPDLVFKKQKIDSLSGLLFDSIPGDTVRLRDVQIGGTGTKATLRWIGISGTGTLDPAPETSRAMFWEFKRRQQKR